MQLPDPSSEPHKGPALRRGKQLAPIQTNLPTKQTSSRLQRPRPVETIVYERPVDKVPLTSESPRLKRRASRGGLLALFTRTKPAKATKANGKLEVRTEEEELHRGDTENSLIGASKNQVATITQDELVKMMSPKLEQVPQSYSAKVAPRSKSLKKDRQSNHLKTWDPPPLFQAYPQSVKHATLAAPILSAEAVLRMDRGKQVSTAKQVTSRNERGSKGRESLTEASLQKPDNAGKSKTRTLDLTSNLEWTTKIFVLATSGFLLQYAGEGSHDRLPEKIMQLGKESAAFASDAIQGKYYVLQVSQAPNEDGSVAKASSKSVLSRMGFRNDLKRSTSSFLLVLDSPEEMSAWMEAVRKEIEALGGKSYRPEIGMRKTTDEVVRTLREKPSRRYLIQKDPRSEQEMLSPQQHLDHSSQGFNYSSNQVADTSSQPPTRRQSLAARISTDAPSTTHSMVSVDQAQLDRLRSSSRFSFTSIGTKTVSTSCGPSPMPSPSVSRFAVDDACVENQEICSTAIADRPRRKSFQTLPSPVTARQESFDLGIISALNLTRRSSMNSPDTLSSSPVAPNFSMRFSHANGLPVGVTVPTLAASANHDAGKHSTARSRQVSDSSDRPESIIGELPSALSKSPKLSRSHASIGGGSSSSVMTTKDTKRQDVQMPFDVTPAGRLVPRRYSSHEHSHTRPPNNLFRHTPSPHPPPQGALPSIPRANTTSLKQPAENQYFKASGNYANSHPKLRRPSSMQVRSDPLPLATKRSFSGEPPSSRSVYESPVSSTPFKPLVQPVSSLKHSTNSQQQNTFDNKNVSSIAPPLYPPPSVTLPNLPPASSRWPEYSMAGRNCIQGVSVA